MYGCLESFVMLQFMISLCRYKVHECIATECTTVVHFALCCASFGTWMFMPLCVVFDASFATWVFMPLCVVFDATIMFIASQLVR